MPRRVSQFVRAKNKRSPTNVGAMSRQFQALQAEMNRTKIDLIKTDLEASMTFATIARESSDTEKTLRNRRNARKGYDSIMHFAATASLTPEDEKQVNEKLGRLKTALVALGDRFPD